jgi:Rhs element Vgr protein
MSVVTATVLSTGKPLDPCYEILAIDVRREVNRIPRAELHLVDGSRAEQRFELSDTELFAPGQEIEIKLRWEGGDEETVFKGLVVRHGVEAIGPDCALVVQMKDAAFKLTAPRKSVVFRDKSDSEIIGELVEQAGLTRGTLAATEPRHPQLVQYAASDWDFIVSRADAVGLLVVANDGEISLARLEPDAKPSHGFEWGIDDIYELEMEADAGHQFAAFESVAWSLQDHELTPVTRARAFKTGQGNLAGDQVASAFGFETCPLSHPVPLDPAELQAWADARMARNRMALLRGRIVVAGFAPVKLLDVMEIAGIGERFNGTALITGIRHRVQRGDWQTDLQLGLCPEGFCRQEAITECPAAGLLPAVSGLRIGVVAPFEDDPDQEYRARVVLPGVGESDTAVWARLAAPDAGQERGYLFRPEPGDEVVVGFLNQDPRQPIVLGSLFGSRNSPPAQLAELSADNFLKGIVTRKGTAVVLDDELAAVRIETPGKNTIIIDDDAESIAISDQHGSSVTLSRDGIEIKSAKDVIIDAGGNVEIKGKKVDIK